MHLPKETLAYDRHEVAAIDRIAERIFVQLVEIESAARESAESFDGDVGSDGRPFAGTIAWVSSDGEGPEDAIAHVAYDLASVFVRERRQFFDHADLEIAKRT